MNLENEVFIKYEDDRFLLFISKKVLDLIGDSEQVVLRDWLGSNWGGDTWRNAYRYLPCGDCFDVDSARETINVVLEGRCVMCKDFVLDGGYLYIKKEVLDRIGESDVGLGIEPLGRDWGFATDEVAPGYRRVPTHFVSIKPIEAVYVRSKIDEALGISKTNTRLDEANERCTMDDKEIEDNIKIVATGEVEEDGTEKIVVLISKYLLNRMDSRIQEEVWDERLHAKWGWSVFVAEDISTMLKDLGLTPCDYRARFAHADSRKDALRIKEEVIQTVKRALRQRILKPTII